MKIKLSSNIENGVLHAKVLFLASSKEPERVYFEDDNSKKIEVRNFKILNAAGEVILPVFERIISYLPWGIKHDESIITDKEGYKYLVKGIIKKSEEEGWIVLDLGPVRYGLRKGEEYSAQIHFNDVKSNTISLKKITT